MLKFPCDIDQCIFQEDDLEMGLERSTAGVSKKALSRALQASAGTFWLGKGEQCGNCAWAQGTRSMVEGDAKDT